jgi:hypothetical protein
MSQGIHKNVKKKKYVGVQAFSCNFSIVVKGEGVKEKEEGNH